ncbi:MAG: hypothetical protein HYY30_03090 [Chloroflexi bacterium]|nr:hypothetical protein [Chloroflexota bacterium]
MMGKHTAGWSTYIAGTGYDLNKFKQEVAHILSYVKSKMKGQAKAA